MMTLSENEFKEEIMIWKKYDICTLKLAKMFIEMVNKFANSSKFNFKITDDHKQNALLKLLLYGKNYNEEKGKCYSYYTQIVMNSYLFDLKNEMKDNVVVTTVENLELYERKKI